MREWVREASVYEWEIAMMFWEVCGEVRECARKVMAGEGMRRRKGKVSS